MAVCELCGFVALRREEVPGFKEFIHCEYCGKYFIDDHSGITPDNKHLLAGYLYMQRNRERRDKYPLITAHEILNDIRIPTTPSRKLDYLLRAMDDISKGRIGAGFSIHRQLNMETIETEQYVQIDIDRTLHLPPAFAYAVNLAEISEMIKLLCRNGYLSLEELEDYENDRQSIYKKNPYRYTINAEGYKRIESLRNTNAESNKVFIALQFRTEDGSTRDDLITAIKAACTECGFEAGTVNETPYNHGIADEIMASIKRSKFVVVDYTYGNKGAYFEAGYARGIGRPLIRCCNSEWASKNGGIEKWRH
jgi:hypothetical protein